MAHSKVVRLQEPSPASGTDALPIHDGIVTNGAAPAGEHARCTKCGSPDLRPHYHRDLIDCISFRGERKSGELRGGEHLHWKCANCDYDFTTKCLAGAMTD